LRPYIALNFGFYEAERGASTASIDTIQYFENEISFLTEKLRKISRNIERRASTELLHFNGK
jgi:hypothetical protein